MLEFLAKFKILLVKKILIYFLWVFKNLKEEKK